MASSATPTTQYVTLLLPNGEQFRVWDRAAQIVLFVAANQSELNEHDYWEIVFDGAPNRVRPNLRKHYEPMRATG